MQLSSGPLHVDVRVGPADRPRLSAAFTVEPGITAMCGPSGAGKSTCLAVIAGLLAPDAGRIALGSRVLFDGESRINVAPHRRRVGVVFQTLALFPHLSSLGNVSYGIPRAMAAHEREVRARSWLDRLRIQHLATRLPATLSGGEAQRVALARALASEPLALLLDEPFGAADVSLRHELGREVAGLVAALRIPTLLVTHDETETAVLGARVIRLSSGRVAEGPGLRGVPEKSKGALEVGRCAEPGVDS